MNGEIVESNTSVENKNKELHYVGHNHIIMKDDATKNPTKTDL